MKRAIVVLAFAMLAAMLPAHSATLRHISGSSSELRGLDSITYEDPENHPFEVWLSLDATATTDSVEDMSPGYGTAMVSIQPLGSARSYVRVVLYTISVFRNLDNTPRINANGIGEDGAPYNINVYGTTNPEIQIDRGSSATGVEQAYIDATGHSSFSINDSL